MKLSILLLFCAAGTAGGALSITDPNQGIFDFTGPGSGLSGLTYLGGNTYRAVSDIGAAVTHPLTINLNLSNGTILNASTSAGLPLGAGDDSEGIAFHPRRGTLFVADEAFPEGSFVREFSLSTGALLTTLEVPAVLKRDRSPLGFESMTFGADTLWTGNEQALEQESQVASSAEGSLVRLLKYDSTLTPAGQWAYMTDPQDSLNDLLALPDGSLLALERASSVGTPDTYRNRIYLLDFTGASDVSGIPDLDAGGFTMVSKTLLWERNMGSTSTHNFEGITLGPMLAPQQFSVLLIADNGTGTQQHLYPLILNGVVPEPTTAGLLFGGMLMLGLRRKTHR